MIPKLQTREHDRVLLKMRCVEGEASQDHDVTSTVTLMTPAKKIREIRASIVELSEVVQRGRVIVSGKIHKQILYVGPDDLVRHQAEEVEFTKTIPVAGARPGLRSQLRGKVESVTFELVDRNTVRQTVTIHIEVKVYRFCQLRVVVDEEGPLLKALVVVAKRAVAGLKEDIQDFEARKLIRVSVRVRDVSWEVVPGQVRVSFKIVKEIFFVDVDNKKAFKEKVLDVMHTVTIPEAEPGMDCQVLVQLGNPFVRLIFPPSCPVSVKIEERLPFSIFVKLARLVQVPVALDPEAGRLVKADVVVAENQKQILVEDLIKIPPAKKIIEVLARARRVRCKVIDDKVIVQGFIHKQIFFVGRDDVVHHIAVDVPFSALIDVPGARPGMHCQVFTRIEHLQADLIRKKDWKPWWWGCDDDKDPDTLDEEQESEAMDSPHHHHHRRHRRKLVLQKVVLLIFVKVTEERQLRVRFVEEEEDPPETPCESTVTVLE